MRGEGAVRGWLARRGATRSAVRLGALCFLTAISLGAVYEWGGPGRRGVRALDAKRYDEAIRSFREAHSSDPHSSTLAFDEALAHAGKGDVDSARAHYREAMEAVGDRGRAAAAYNLGNEAMRAKQYAQAARLYRESLRARPSDLDAKRNLEEAIRAQRGTPPPSRPQQGQGPGKPPPEQQGGTAGTPPPRAQSPPREPPRGEPGAFTREEAERWLQALEEERKASRHEGKAQHKEETGRRDW